MEILNVSTATIDYLGGWSASVIILILIGSGCIITGFICNNEGVFKVLIILGALLLFGACFDYSTNNPVKVTTYQVILDDNICYNEFVEKYEVIKQEGRIYTIYEKDKEN